MVLTRKCKLNPYALQSIKSENVGEVFGRVQDPSSIVICNSINVYIVIIATCKEPRKPKESWAAGRAIISSAGGRALGGTMVPIWILEQSQSYMSVAEVPEWSPPPLASPWGRGAGEEHGLRSQILVGILAHHLLAIYLGQCPL